MARPVLPRPGLAVRAAALHPAPLRVFPGLAELPDFSTDRLRAPPSPRVFPGLAAGPATLLLPSPAPPRAASLVCSPSEGRRPLCPLGWRGECVFGLRLSVSGGEGARPARGPDQGWAHPVSPRALPAPSSSAPGGQNGGVEQPSAARGAGGSARPGAARGTGAAPRGTARGSRGRSRAP